MSRTKRRRCRLLAFVAGLSVLVLEGAPARTEAPPDPAWQTAAEASGFTTTASYEETLAFLRRLEGRFPTMSLGYYGSSAEGRRLPVVVVAKERLFTAKRLRALPRPIVFVVSATRGGDPSGKEAALMLLRDLALGRHAEMLDQITLVFVPIYNVDGHERMPRDRAGRPTPMDGFGVRTTAQRLDLDADYLKLGTEEARSLVALFNQWRPHLILDTHAAGGLGHALAVTYAHAEAPQIHTSLGAWLGPRVEAAAREATAAGHRAGVYVETTGDADPAGGVRTPVYRPRHSTGYFALRNRPAVRIATHLDTPLRDRVLASRALLLALLGEAGREGAALRGAVEEAERAVVEAGAPSAAPSEIALDYRLAAPEPLRYPLYDHESVTSVVTGAPVRRFTPGRVSETTLPWSHRPLPAAAVPRPRGYLVLPGWPQIEERLRWHGLRFERVEQPVEADVEVTRLKEPHFADAPDQGLTRVTSMQVDRRSERRRIVPGTLWVPASQADFALAVHLLEPAAPESLVSTGLLSSIFEAQMPDAHLLENEAGRMLERDAALSAEWKRALADPAFADDPAARLRWFEERLPLAGETAGVLPAFRVTGPVPLVTRRAH